jgi:hypothetical protein
MAAFVEFDTDTPTLLAESSEVSPMWSPLFERRLRERVTMAKQRDDVVSAARRDVLAVDYAHAHCVPLVAVCRHDNTSQ